MKLAFCLFKYFPYGGLQRDFLRIAHVCVARGHDVHVYVMSWEGEPAAGLTIHLLPPQGWQNHSRGRVFAEQVAAAIAKESFDLVVGFNKMPGLDIYYAADVCYAARVAASRSWFYRWLPRYRQLAAMERAVFAADQATDILLIAPPQQAEYQCCYETAAARFHLLPPGIAKDRAAPADAAERRATLRSQYNLSADDLLLLMVGSGFKTKGLDRVLAGIAALPTTLRNKTRLFVVGQDNPAVFQKQAQALNVDDNIHFLGGRPDVPDFLLAADLLVHPAYHENTGTVLLEAMIAGLPVLTVDVCGYAHYVAEANAGIVLASPFQQAAFNEALQSMLLSSERVHWRENGLQFAKQADIYSLPDKAADIIEQVGRQRATLSA